MSKIRSEAYIQRKKKKLNSRRRKRSAGYQLRKKIKKNSRHRIKNKDYLNRQREYKQLIRSDYETCVKNYERNIRDGPIHICNCCGGLFFSIGVKSFSELGLNDNLDNQLVKNVIAIDTGDKVLLCITCSRDLFKGKVPKLCLVNGLDFPEVPEELKSLRDIEERYISPRLPFMQVRELGIDRQLGLRGNVVNVPISLEDTVEKLPRNLDQMETIQICLKRKLEFRHNYMNEIIRPNLIIRAAQYLVLQPLYMEENVKLSSDWINEHNGCSEEFIVEEEDKNIFKDSLALSERQDEVEDWDETVNLIDINPGTQETLLKQEFVFAPGEGKKPLSLINDRYVEELSFPTIYCGQKFEPTVKLSYNDRIKSELRRYDRRCCKIPNIFFKLRKKEAIAMNSAIQIYLRKTTFSSDLNANKALDKQYIEQLIRSDEAYRVLQHDRCSPAYWSCRMAMIRQLGIPTFFLTLSSAETRWNELLVILKKVLENKVISEEEASELDYREKCNLIRNDPVTCARYFDRRYRELFKLLQVPNGPFGEYKLIDFYIRVEFQQRGSGHIHSLIWLENAPNFEANDSMSRINCQQFISRFISCETSDSDLNDLVRYQYHKHSKTCKKTKFDSVVCRFGVPLFPMKETLILDPLADSELTEVMKKELKIILKRIVDVISSVDEEVRKTKDFTMTFDNFLCLMNITIDIYILAIRSTLKRSKIFLKRAPHQIRTNGYNKQILLRHRANIDLQYVLDPYACVHYILNYINKADRGMSHILKQVIEECNDGYLTHQQKLYRICSKFINCSEVSSQEAIFILLSIPLSKTSRSVIFINTGEKSQRIKLLKSENDLKELDPESKDVLSYGLLDYYVSRPTELENVCLADFAAKYNYSKSKNISFDEDVENDIEESNPEMFLKTYKLLNNKGWVTERGIKKVIRFRKYQIEKDPWNYFREKTMLYIPWRDEDKDILGINCVDKFYENEDLIRSIERQYVSNSDLDYTKIQLKIEQEIIDESNVEDEEVAENSEYKVFDLDRFESDINVEFAALKSSNNSEKGIYASPIKLDDDIYWQMIKCLNEKQRNYLLGVMNSIKNDKNAFYHFVNGNAGTGKSMLIKAIYNTMNRYYNRLIGIPDAVYVLLTGPTGMSAYNIGGTTVHSALGLNVSQNNRVSRMSESTRNTIRSKLWHLKLIIIDEVSMIGSSTLRKIDNQLKQIFDTDQKFGGISIVFFGDFNQLRPVNDRYIFQSPKKNDYSLIAGPLLWRSIKIYTLDEIMRQKNDLIFAQALTNLASGNLNENEKNLFRSRLFALDSPELPVDAIRLYSTNKKVDEYNDMVLEKLPETGYISYSDDIPASGFPKSCREQALRVIAFMSTQKTKNLPKKVLLKKNIRYMITSNIKIADGLVNGSTGILRAVDTALVDNEVVPEVIWLEFENIQIGLSTRSQFKERRYDGRILTPIRKIALDIQTPTSYRLVLVTRKQFPVVVAEAITIHKSQGQSYDQVVVDLSFNLDIKRMYTSFSRAKTSEGLFLVGADELIFPNKRDSNDKVDQEMSRLKSESPLIFSLKFSASKNHDKNVIKIFYQNFPYLARNIERLVCDKNVIEADIIMTVETYSINAVIEGYILLDQIGYDGSRPFGTTVFVKQFIMERMRITSSGKNCIYRTDSHLEYISIGLENSIIIVCYISPKFPKVEALNCIDTILHDFSSITEKKIMLGDFNIDINSDMGERLRNVFWCHGMEFCLEKKSNSTDSGSQIDLAFSSIKTTESYYYESIASDHKPIFIELEKDVLNSSAVESVSMVLRSIK